MSTTTSGATFNETHELSEAGGTFEEDAEEEEEEEEESEDAEEAFNDLEEETMLCADYVPQTRNKRLPDAIIIGARKVNTNHFDKKSRGSIFFTEKRPNRGRGGPRGVWQKTTLFPKKKFGILP